MKISTKGRYGLRILLDLALHGSGHPRMIRDIAESQQISEKYISRLIINLRQAGLVRSVRGAGGGYFLARKPESVSILEVIEVMEGPLALIDCVGRDDKCVRSQDCIAREAWTELNAGIKDVFSGMTIRNVLDRQKPGRPFYECRPVLSAKDCV